MIFPFRPPFIIVFIVLLQSYLGAASYEIADLETLNETVKVVQPGDVLHLRSGDWNDFEFVFAANGTEGKPIILTGAVDGSTRLNGTTRIVFGGDYLQVSNLHLDRAVARPKTTEIVSFKYEEDAFANHCRLTNIYFDHTNPANENRRYQWVRLSGQHNRVDHCRFEGQNHRGVTVQAVVTIPDAQHRIDHNHFLDRPAGAQSNGYESIQIGQSYDSMKSGNCVVEFNLFEHCDGETEIVSNKTCSNTYRGNLFFESRGSLTLRHGNGCLIEENVFIGNNKPNTGGVRIIGEDHIVRRNYFEGLTGYTGGVIVFYAGIPDSELNGYFASHRALVEDNILVENTGNSFYLNGGFGKRERSILPTNIRISGNILQQSGSGVTLFSGHLDDLVLIDNIAFESNETGLSDVKGITFELFPLKRNEDGLLVPQLAESDENEVIRVPARLKRSEVGPEWM